MVDTQTQSSVTQKHVFRLFLLFWVSQTEFDYQADDLSDHVWWSNSIPVIHSNRSSLELSPVLLCQRKNCAREIASRNNIWQSYNFDYEYVCLGVCEKTLVLQICPNGSTSRCILLVHMLSVPFHFPDAWQTLLDDPIKLYPTGHERTASLPYSDPDVRETRRFGFVRSGQDTTETKLKTKENTIKLSSLFPTKIEELIIWLEMIPTRASFWLKREPTSHE